ncbi:hypothetical protein [Streptomyces sp. P3]|uniref:hypothetical protein n=1 Tax=Streptomyces sp. P3 TaxID=2135430 RepID=UPI001C1F5B74|nr:hypothetical protein [Streptomyces sp. P3]
MTPPTAIGTGHYARTEPATSDHEPVEAACLRAVAALTVKITDVDPPRRRMSLSPTQSRAPGWEGQRHF